MRKVGLVYDTVFLGHHSNGQETAERVSASVDELQKQSLWPLLTPISARPATKEELRWGHSERHIQSILQADGIARTQYDADTFAEHGTTQAALHAVGGGIELVKAVVKKQVQTGFLLARPPGHHANYDDVMGFCFFNNIAIAAQYLLNNGLKRVMIVDVDVHHGNGTQSIFEKSPNVLFTSVHQSPFYPGTGMIEDAGLGAGEGFTVNFPLKRGALYWDYDFYLKSVVDRLADQFKPDFLLISMGYDSYKHDPIGDMKLDIQDFYLLSKTLLTIAKKHCQDRIAFFLEGGYSIEGVSQGVVATCQALLQGALSLEYGVNYDHVRQSTLETYAKLAEVFATTWWKDWHMIDESSHWGLDSLIRK